MSSDLGVSSQAEDDYTFLVRAGRELIEMNGLTDYIPIRDLDPQFVPTELHVLIPCAKQWNIGDDYYRGHILENAPSEILRLLVQTVHKHIDVLGDWLHREYIETSRTGKYGTEEAGAFLWLMTGAVEAKGILESRFGEVHDL